MLLEYMVCARKTLARDRLDVSRLCASVCVSVYLKKTHPQMAQTNKSGDVVIYWRTHTLSNTPTHTESQNGTVEMQRNNNSAIKTNQ